MSICTLAGVSLASVTHHLAVARIRVFVGVTSIKAQYEREVKTDRVLRVAVSIFASRRSDPTKANGTALEDGGVRNKAVFMGSFTRAEK